MKNKLCNKIPAVGGNIFKPALFNMIGYKSMFQTRPKRKYRFSILIILFCIFCFTAGQFIPIYFQDSGFRALFYFAIFIILIITVSRAIFNRVSKSIQGDVSSAWLYSILFGLGTFIVFGLWTLGLLFSFLTEASVLFVKKSNPEIKIVSRYISLGAFGGGTETDDYEIVLHRPFLFFLKLETSVDTAKINKSNWIRWHE